MEAMKTHKQCAKSFWQFVSQILDESAPLLIHPSQLRRLSLIREVYDYEQKSFMRPNWLPVPPSPTTPLNNDEVIMEELQSVVPWSRVKLASYPGHLQRT